LNANYNIRGRENISGTAEQPSLMEGVSANTNPSLKVVLITNPIAMWLPSQPFLARL
jgi:hypothetical protein|tara:strand:+ start:10056 stop:10226 length:171 start_codon:yes stop_codon:yes gene_type:complete